MLNLKKVLAKTLASLKSPIKVVDYGWIVSPTLSANTRIGEFSPLNNSEGKTEPAGYTFVAWVNCASVGWVGTLYPVSLTNRATIVYTPSGKSTITTGVSLRMTALYIRSELL